MKRNRLRKLADIHCVKDMSHSVAAPHFDIGVYAPNANPGDDNSLIDLLLVQGKRSLSVIQDVDTETTTPLTAKEVDILMDQIATSARQEDRQSKIAAMVGKVREDMQKN